MEIRNTILSQNELKLLEDIILKYGKIVSFEQLKEAGSKYSLAELRNKVSLLSKKGWLIRLKKGLYAVITDISTLGFNDVSEYIISQALNKDSYISFENALQYHSMFDQMLLSVDAVTDKKARKYQIKNTQHRFFHIKKELYFGFTKVQVNGKTVSIADKEKALLDMLYFKTSAYTVSIVLEKLREYKHRLDFDKLQQYTQKFGTGMVRMVGFLLDQIEVDTNALHISIGQVKNSYNRLTRQSLKFNAKWRLYYDPYLIN